MKTARKSMIFIIALILGISYSPLEVMALSGQEQKQSLEQEDSRKERANSEEFDMACLQIPEKLEITIDPFEINGKGQIYSEQYNIKNSGNTEGTLILSDFVCKLQKEKGIIVRPDNIGIHEGREKCVYLEALFGNGEKVILSQTGAKYEVKLNPGEQLSLTFSGEVNENAIRKWEDNDVTVSMVYSWNMDKSASDKLDKQKSNNITEILDGVEAFNTKLDDSRLNDRIDEMVEESMDDGSKELDRKELEDALNADEKIIVPVKIEAELVENKERFRQKEDNDQEITEADSEGEVGDQKSGRTQGLQIPEKLEITVDPFEVDGKGQIYSDQYKIRNSGNTTGKLSLYDFKYNCKQESGVSVKTDKTGIYDNEEKSIYIEAIFGNGSKVILSQPNTKYEVELRPGEEFLLAFSGEVNEKTFEKWKADKIKVSIDYEWDMGVEESSPTSNIEEE